MSQKKYATTQEVPVQLSEADGNVFAIIGRTRKALLRAGFAAEATAYANAARQCPNYDAVLQLTMRTVDVS